MAERVTQTIEVGNPTGTLEAYGRKWPTFSKPALHVEGYVDGDDMEGLKAELERRLEGLPFIIHVGQRSLVTMTPEDEAEYLELSNNAAREAGYGN